MMVLFIGIWIWAWRPRHQANFGRLARLPLDDLAPSAATAARPSDAAGQGEGAAS
ncbi:MAG: cbb3-type cytochrome c oxidase subunit 3 [Sterolibacterium sp.]|nr:cbb3-type cytochrome c oxidase subunit 3 [Sterolibacterium sp.]